MKRDRTIEVILWSIALPGFGQLLNKQVIKGIIFILLEVVINMYSHFNSAIMLSFLGDIKGATAVTNYQWLMFYPCVYFYSMWDAYKFAHPDLNTKPYFFMPFVFAAYFVTVGLMYSDKIPVYGYILGPVWLPIIFVIPGLATGFFIRYVLLHFTSNVPNN